MAAVAWMVCVGMFCVSTLSGWILWLHNQPPCTKAEFEKVVKQLNQLTVDFAEVKVTADSVRSAVGMVRGIGR